MGLARDAGVLIAAERDARPVSELLTKLEHKSTVKCGSSSLQSP